MKPIESLIEQLEPAEIERELAEVAASIDALKQRQQLLKAARKLSKFSHARTNAVPPSRAADTGPPPRQIPLLESKGNGGQ